MNNPGLLAVVVVTRNEERRIGRCLASVFKAIAPYPGTRVVVVDSDSRDETTRIATRYPAAVYRYRGPVRSPAAGRRIGFEQVDARFVLFVDGDCTLNAAWLPEALDAFDRHSAAAVVYGGRREIIERRGVDRQAGATWLALQGQGYPLGGNALYRADALCGVGGFNPFLQGNEEAELLGRLRSAGFEAVATPTVMVTHYGDAPKDTALESARRWRRGYSRGVGQILRVALTQGLFLYYLRQWKPCVIVLAFLAGGVMVGLFGLVSGVAWPALLWLVLGAGAFSVLAVRRTSLKEAAWIVASWLVVAVDLLPAFLRRPRSPGTFRPEIEKLSDGLSLPPAGAEVSSPSDPRRAMTGV